jgi:hypothetical protein
MPRLTHQAKSLPLQREFGRVALPSVRSNGPTDPLHISCICSIWKILHFYSSFSLNPSKSAFFHTLTLSLLPKLQKIRFVFFVLDKKDPKLSLSELLSMMTRIQFNLTLFIWPSMWTRLEHAHCLETINNMWFLGKRESVNVWKKADFDGFKEKEELWKTIEKGRQNASAYLSSKHNLCHFSVSLDA